MKPKFRGYSGSGPTDQFGILCYSLALESFLYQLVVRSGRRLKIASNRVRLSFLFLWEGRQGGSFIILLVIEEIDYVGTLSRSGPHSDFDAGSVPETDVPGCDFRIDPRMMSIPCALWDL